MIKKIHLTNFKGVSDTVEIELKPITLLFGPNSAGKSTIIHALHYLKEIFERKNFDPMNTQTGGKAISLGGFRSLVNNHDLSKTITLRIDLEPVTHDVDASSFTGSIVTDSSLSYDYSREQYENYQYYVDSIYSNANEYSVEIDIKWHSKLNKAVSSQFKVYLENKILMIIDESRSTDRVIYYQLAEINFNHPSLKNAYGKEELKSFKGTFEIFKGQINTELNQEYVIPDWYNDFIFSEDFVSRLSEDRNSPEVRFLSIIKTVINNIGLQVEEELKALRYIGPLREVPQRNFLPHSQAEEERWSNGLAAWDAIYNKKVSLELLNKWMDKLKIGYNFHLNQYYNLNSEKINEVKQYFRKKNDELIEEAKDYYHETENESKKLELTFYTELDKLREKLTNKDNDNIDNTIDNLHEKFRDQLTVFNDNQLELWASIWDAFDSIEECLDDDFREMLPENQMLEKIELYDKIKQIYVEPYDIGIGISEVLPVVTAALMSYQSVLAVEQSELHIHPAMQVELADLFIEEINKRRKSNLVFLVETHSEHIILRFLRRIEETYKSKQTIKYPLKKDQINVYYLDSKEKGLDVTHLPIDETGEFTKDWPDGFFEERSEELFPDD